MYKRKTLSLASTFMLSGAAIAFCQGPPADIPFQARGDRGETVHVLPTPAAAAKAVSGAAQPLFAPSVTTTPKVYPASYGFGKLSNHGGLEIANAGYFAVYWNSTIAGSNSTSLGYASIQNQIAAFVTSFGGAATNYTQNNTSDYTIIQQYGVKAPISKNLPYRGTFVDSQSAVTSISDTAIQTYLGTLFGNGSVVANSSTLYGVYFPSGTTVTMGSSASCSSFCGYHSVFSYNGMQIKYAVFPYPDCSGCSLGAYGLAAADMLTIVGSHEIREAVTDPGDNAQNAWYDLFGYEADDKCAWHNLYQMTNGKFWVQPEFSNGGTVTASGFKAAYPGSGCVVP